ncbi:SetB [Aquitalea magnusonii]|nr:SetB [Aquitalea magnusonii]
MSTPFRLKQFIAARFLGSLGDQFLLFVVPLAIFKSTGNIKYSGLAFMIEWLPRIVFFPLAGFFVDRLNPKYLLSGVDAGRALVLLGALTLIVSGASTFAVLSLMMALLSIAYILNFVAGEALLPRNLEAHALPKANSLMQGVDQITQIMGPAMAAVISVWGGLTPILLAGSGLFACSALLQSTLRSQSMPAQHSFSLGDIYESNRLALRVLLDNKVLFHLSALTWVVNLVYGAALVVSASVVLKAFALPESYFGVLQTTAAITSIVTFGLVPRFAQRFGISTLGVTSFCAMILAGLILAVSSHYTMYLLGYAALMAFDGVFSVYIRTVRSQIIPKEHLGKTTGLIGLMNMCSIPLSAAAVTILSAHFSPFGIFGMIFILAAILGVGLVWFGRSFFGYRTWLPTIPAAVEL